MTYAGRKRAARGLLSDSNDAAASFRLSTGDGSRDWRKDRAVMEPPPLGEDIKGKNRHHIGGMGKGKIFAIPGIPRPAAEATTG